MTADIYDIVLAHYKYRIEKFLDSDDVKKIASAPLREELEELRSRVTLALRDWRDLGGAAGLHPKDHWEDTYSDILTPAKKLFKDDSDKFIQSAERELGVELKKLKDDSDYITV